MGEVKAGDIKSSSCFYSGYGGKAVLKIYGFKLQLELELLSRSYCVNKSVCSCFIKFKRYHNFIAKQIKRFKYVTAQYGVLIK